MVVNRQELIIGLDHVESGILKMDELKLIIQRCSEIAIENREEDEPELDIELLTMIDVILRSKQVTK